MNDGAEARVPVALARLAVVTVVLLAALLGVFELYDYDLGLARASGRWIVEHGTVPVTNVFSELHHDYPFVDDKWLFHVLAYLTVDQLGATIAILLRAVLLAGLGLLLLPRGAGSRRTCVAALLAVVALVTASERFAYRPELFTLMFLAVFCRKLLRARPPTRGEWALLLGLQIVWTNLHGYFVLGPIVAGATAVGALLDGWLRRERENASAPRFLLLLALTGVALVNPYGWRLAWSPVGLLLDLRANFALYSEAITEFVPPFGDYPVLPSDLLAYRVLLVVVALALALGLRRVRLTELLPVLTFLVMSLSLRRNAAMFAVVAAPVAAVWLDAGFAAITRDGRRSAAVVALLAGGTTLLLAAWLGFCHVTDRLGVHDRLPKQFGIGFSAVAHPDLEIDFVLAELPSAVLFNSFSFGSYFTGRAFPGRTPFIDGNTAGYDAGFLEEYARVVKGETDVDRFVARYAVTQFLVKPGHALTAALLADERYVPLLLGRQACVIVVRDAFPEEFVERHDLRRALTEGRFQAVERTPPTTFWRRTEPVAELNRARFLAALARYEQAAAACEDAIAVNPDLYEPWLELGIARLAAGSLAAALTALDRAVALVPGSAVARSEHGLILLQMQEYERAETDLRAALDLDPDHALSWFRLAYLCSRLPGRHAEAVAAAREALRLSPRLEQARQLLAALGGR